MLVLRALVVCVAMTLSACASTPYVYGTGRAQLDAGRSPDMTEQILVGRPNRFLDASDWFWPGSLLGKLMLWNKRVDSHQVSEASIDALRDYLHANELNDVQVLVNRYSPRIQWRRLIANRTVGAGWRYTLGLFSVAYYTVLPGRLFGGDHYNPYTNTISLYSDIPVVALHEGGHAKDTGTRQFKGTHAALYALPFVSLFHEARATSDALGYLRCTEDTGQLQDGYRTLYPAYSTYVGANLLAVTSLPKSVAAMTIIPGHIAGRVAANRSSEESAADKPVCLPPTQFPEIAETAP